MLLNLIHPGWLERRHCRQSLGPWRRRGPWRRTGRKKWQSPDQSGCRKYDVFQIPTYSVFCQHPRGAGWRQALVTRLRVIDSLVIRATGAVGGPRDPCFGRFVQLTGEDGNRPEWWLRHGWSGSQIWIKAMAIWRCCRRLYRSAKVEGKRAGLKRFGSKDLDQEIWIKRSG